MYIQYLTILWLHLASSNFMYVVACIKSFSFLRPNNIPLYVDATFCLFLHVSKDIWVDSTFWLFMGFPGGSDGKASACNVGNPGLIPELGRSLEKEMATYSSTHAWKIPWTEESGRLQSLGSQRRSDTPMWLHFWLFWVMLLWTWVYKCLQVPGFISLRYIARRGIAGSCCIQYFEELPYHFRGGYTILHSHQPCSRVPVYPHY